MSKTILDLLSLYENSLERVESGELVVVYEAEYDEAEGLVNAENVYGGKREMLVRQITDLSFVPNPDWVCFCMTSEMWNSAKGRDTILWNSKFGEQDNG